MLNKIVSIILLAVLSVGLAYQNSLNATTETRTIEAKVGGKIAPDGKTEIDLDFPGYLHVQNTASKGLGLCVFTSVGHCSVWQNIGVLDDFAKWIRDSKIEGGSWPERTEKLINQICKERNVPVPSYIQIEGKRETLPLIKAAVESGRMVGVTYGFSPSGRYNSRPISHMVNLVSISNGHYCILDNNYVGQDNYEWLTEEEFYQTFTSRNRQNGWAIIFLGSTGPQNLPWN